MRETDLATSRGIASDRVKGGVTAEVWQLHDDAGRCPTEALMRSEVVEKRLTSILVLSRQGKRINGTVPSPLLPIHLGTGL